MDEHDNENSPGEVVTETDSTFPPVADSADGSETESSASSGELTNNNENSISQEEENNNVNSETTESVDYSIQLDNIQSTIDNIILVDQAILLILSFFIFFKIMHSLFGGSAR